MKPKGRPKKVRQIQNQPKIDRFSPRGKAGRPDELNLALDEYEALRLADYQGMSQKQAAKSMRISQQTFSRILKRARKATADMMVNGKIIKIQGGRYAIKTQQIPHQINLQNVNLDLESTPNVTPKSLKITS